MGSRCGCGSVCQLRALVEQLGAAVVAPSVVSFLGFSSVRVDASRWGSRPRIFVIAVFILCEDTVMVRSAVSFSCR